MVKKEFAPEHLRLMEKGIDLFNSQFYWECHEELEGHWLEARAEDIRYIYWAVIQVAASLVHVQNRNQLGAQGLIKKSQEKFKKIENFDLENDLLNNSLKWQELKKLVFDLGSQSSLCDFEKLAQFRF